MKDIKIGSRVCLIDDWKMTGEVVARGKDKWSFMVQWDLNAAPSEEGEDELRICDPWKDKVNLQDLQKRIDEAKSALVIAFEKLQGINDDVYDKFNVGLSELKYQELISMTELEKTLDNGGWRSSSLYC